MPRAKKNQGGALLESAVASGVLLGAAAAAASMSDAPAKFAARVSRSMRGGMAAVPPMAAAPPMAQSGMAQSGMASVTPGVMNPAVQAQMPPAPPMMKGGGAVVAEMAGGAKKRRVGRPCSPRTQKGGEYNAFVGPVDQALVDAQPSPVAAVVPVPTMNGGKARKGRKAHRGGADLAEQYASLVPNLNFMMSETHATAVPAMLAADPNAAVIQTGAVGMPAVMAGGRKRRGRGPAKGKKGGSDEEEEKKDQEEKEEEDQDGGRRRRRAPRRKTKKGGSEEEKKDQEEKDQEDQEDQEGDDEEKKEGGRKRRAPRRKTKKGGAPDGVGLPAAGAAPGVIESNLNFMMKGGKKATKKSGGALDMYAEQLAALTQKLAALKAF